MKLKFKRGDEVVVISGSHKGDRGKVLEVVRNAEDSNRTRVVIEGVAMRKIHRKPRNPSEQGGIIEREGSIHYSNVMLASRYDSRRKADSAN